MLVSGFSDWVPRKKELLKGRFASHQPQCKPEATAIKVNVGTAMEIQFETGVTFQRLRVEVLQCPQLPCFEPCRFLPSLQPHHNTQPSSKSISDFFSQLGSCSKPAKNLSSHSCSAKHWNAEQSQFLVAPRAAASSGLVLCLTEPALNIAFLPFLKGPSLLIFSCCLGHLVQAAAILKKGTVCFCLWKS